MTREQKKQKRNEVLTIMGLMALLVFTTRLWPILLLMMIGVFAYANGILDKLRELQVDLRANPAIFIGGGSILFQNFIEESSQVAQADFVLDSKANAIGYGMLATAQLRRMTQQNHGGEFFAEG